jgi:hypothetical protein
LNYFSKIEYSGRRNITQPLTHAKMSTPNFGKIEHGDLGIGRIIYATGYTEKVYPPGGHPYGGDPIPVVTPTKRWWVHRIDRHNDVWSQGGPQRSSYFTLIDNHGQSNEFYLQSTFNPYGATPQVYYTVIENTGLPALADEVIAAIKRGRPVVDAIQDKKAKDRDQAQQKEIAELKAQLAAAVAKAELEAVKVAKAELEAVKAAAAEAEATKAEKAVKAELEAVKAAAEAAKAELEAVKTAAEAAKAEEATAPNDNTKV